MRFAGLIGFLLCVVGCQSETTELPVTTNRHIVRAFQDPAVVESTEVKTTAVKIVGMMCPHGCYPQVESIISKTGNIESVELAQQLTKDAIDNPVVFVKFRGELDKDAITKGITEAGFESVEFLE